LGKKLNKRARISEDSGDFSNSEDVEDITDNLCEWAANY
jgi:hypothetical protein